MSAGGHQPLGIAWPKAFLERAGCAPATLDLAFEPWDDAAVRRARLVAIAVPMHTALRLGVRAALRMVTFRRLRVLAAERAGRPVAHAFRRPPPERPIPARLTEPWFC